MAEDFLDINGERVEALHGLEDTALALAHPSRHLWTQPRTSCTHLGQASLAPRLAG